MESAPNVPIQGETVSKSHFFSAELRPFGRATSVNVVFCGSLSSTMESNLTAKKRFSFAVVGSIFLKGFEDPPFPPFGYLPCWRLGLRKHHLRCPVHRALISHCEAK